MPISTIKPHRVAALAELDVLREDFRARISMARRPAAFSSRVGVVLSGGGARGAYEAGVLMAFQDAQVPTHIIAATSVGSINAASFAAHSEGLIGKAEALVDAWMDLTPATLGIDWSRYIFLLAGLVAASVASATFSGYGCRSTASSCTRTIPRSHGWRLALPGSPFCFSPTSFLTSATLALNISASGIGSRIGARPGFLLAQTCWCGASSCCF